MPLAVVIVAYAVFAVLSVILVVIDARTHRLPNALVLPAYPVALVLLALACLLGWPWDAFFRGLVGGAALFAFYLVLRLVQPRGMGGGDVKLAGLVGLHLGFLGWEQLVVGAFAGFLLGGLYGVLLILRRRAHGRSRIAFGPWMLAGTWAVILTTTASAIL
ncbi:A24 family peptidase [Microbacterium sp. X-17]|uniref:A24 family peptidase n=1 Tax=Microbacterium sp. X-17 TaxID=3144404 RepID=UPI0031F4C4CE